MSKIRDFSIAIPFLCEAQEPKRASAINRLIFDEELKNNGSPFQRTENDKLDPYNRMKPFFRFDNGNKKSIEHCKKLLRIAELSHYKSEHAIEDKEIDELEQLITSATIDEDDEDLSSIVNTMTVTQALATDTWNG